MRSLHSFSPRRSRNRLIKPFVFVRRRFSERSFFGLIFRAEKTPHGYTLYNYFMSLSTILRLSRRNVENKCGGAAGHNKASPWEKALKCRVERTRRRAAMGKYSLPLWLTFRIVTSIFFKKEREMYSTFFRRRKK